VTQALISIIESQGTSKSLNIAKLAKALECNALWLETGSGPEEIDEQMPDDLIERFAYIYSNTSTGYRQMIDKLLELAASETGKGNKKDKI